MAGEPHNKNLECESSVVDNGAMETRDEEKPQEKKPNLWKKLLQFWICNSSSSSNEEEDKGEEKKKKGLKEKLKKKMSREKKEEEKHDQEEKEGEEKKKKGVWGKIKDGANIIGSIFSIAVSSDELFDDAE